MLNSKVKKYIEQNKLIQPGDMVIVGVSGGPDSMALLHILNNIASSLDFKVAAAHLNHGLRPEAGAEEAFVKETCEQLGITCYSCTVPVAELAKEQKTTVEDAGRNARYGYFNQLLKEIGAQHIATAHHHDDVAETVLLHFLRGSGIKGLRGIMPVNGNLIRPLLTVTKEELLTYLQERNINYCLDKSNNDPYYLRNRIRHGLIPYLQKEFNPRIVGKLNQLALIAKDENEALEEEAGRLWTGVILKEDKESLIINLKTLSLLHRAYQRRIILRAFAQLSGETGWSLDDVEKVLDLSSKQGSSLTLQLKKKVRVNKSYDTMVFTTCIQESVKFLYKVSIPGRVEIAETEEVYSFELVDRQNFSPDIGDIYLDYDRLPETLCLRSRRVGDIYKVPGMFGTKKLKKLFIDLKIPSSERDRIALLTGEDHEVYAVLGIGISRTAAINPNSRSILLIKKA